MGYLWDSLIISKIQVSRKGVLYHLKIVIKYMKI